MALMGMGMGRIRLMVVSMVMAMVGIKVRVRIKGKGKAMAMAMAMATVESAKSGCSSRLVLPGRRLDRQNVSLRCIEGWEAGRGFNG
jgi:hypothetical protein